MVLHMPFVRNTMQSRDLALSLSLALSYQVDRVFTYTFLPSYSSLQFLLLGSSCDQIGRKERPFHVDLYLR